MEVLKKCENEVDVIVLAQGSMTVLIPELGVIKKPVLTSPELGVMRAAEMLKDWYGAGYFLYPAGAGGLRGQDHR